jgi:hypothetical protein
VAAGEYYDEFLRPHLPAGLRGLADDAFGAVLAGSDLDWLPADRNDLAADAATPPHSDILYAMRPATARAVARLSVPWDELRGIGERHPAPADGFAPLAASDHRTVSHSFADLENVAWPHLACVAKAAATSRGIVTIVSC